MHIIFIIAIISWPASLILQVSISYMCVGSCPSLTVCFKSGLKATHGPILGIADKIMIIEVICIVAYQ